MNFGYRERETAGKYCRDCKERYSGCHDRCEKYQSALKEWIDYKHEIDSKRKKENEYWIYHGKSVQKTKDKTKHARPKIK